MIFDLQRHERVTEAPWDEAAARAAIEAIAGDADAAFDDDAVPDYGTISKVRPRCVR